MTSTEAVIIVAKFLEDFQGEGRYGSIMVSVVPSLHGLVCVIEQKETVK